MGLWDPGEWGWGGDGYPKDNGDARGDGDTGAMGTWILWGPGSSGNPKGDGHLGSSGAMGTMFTGTMGTLKAIETPRSNEDPEG